MFAACLAQTSSNIKMCRLGSNTTRLGNNAPHDEYLQRLVALSWQVQTPFSYAKNKKKKKQKAVSTRAGQHHRHGTQWSC